MFDGLESSPPPPLLLPGFGFWVKGLGFRI